MLLEIDNITLLYGRIQALHGISLTVDEGEIVALIGANGAGKTTTMRAISGLRPVAAGRIRFDGDDITKLRADLRVIRGICQSPEGRGVFPGMTVRENLEMGAYTRRDGAGDREGHGARAGAVPAAAGAAQAAGRHAVRRRAADARGRAGADEPAQAAAARRAVDGARADADPADLRDHHGDQPSGTVRPSCWSSRTRSRRCPAPTGRTCWKPAGSSRRAPGQQLLNDPAVKDAYLGVA